ncbi:MAG: NAD(P)-dependent oxidoreductase, partial [Candidatus Kariarchaeaceae archaeon]
IQQEAFFKALKNKVIAGAGIDVWYNYQPTEDENGAKYPADYEFHDLDNVVLSPHRAASPFDNLERWDEQIENLKRIAAGRTDLLNLVNLDLEY